MQLMQYMHINMNYDEILNYNVTDNYGAPIV